jgi:glycosyltransferase involved in cell wall biosynthesis
MKLKSSRLSVVAICKNERENLVPFLRSAGQVADEIVIVDTGSTDGTVEMLHRLDFREKGSGRGLKLRRFEWCNDFAAARNFALSHATGDWVLWLDLDDRLEVSAPDFILPLVQYPRRDKAFAFQTRSLTGEEGVFMPHMHLRMFPRLPGLRWEGKVHENLEPSLRAAGIEVEPVPPCIILHLGYQDAKAVQAKAFRNAKILEADKLETYLKFYYLGDAYLQLSAHDLAVINFQRAAAHAEHEGQRHKAKERLTVAHLMTGNLQAAKDVALSLPDGTPERQFLEGETAYLEKRYNEAKPLYEAVLAHNPDLSLGTMASYVEAYQKIARRRLGQMEGKHAEKGSPGEQEAPA